MRQTYRTRQTQVILDRFSSATASRSQFCSSIVGSPSSDLQSFLSYIPILHTITLNKKHRCGSHKPAGWGWSNVQQTDGRTDGLIEEADEGEKAGHISSLGYPMTLYTNYGASWTCTPKIFVVTCSWEFWLDWLVDERTDKGGDEGNFSPFGYPMNLHIKNRCPM